MKICMVIGSLRAGGAERVAVTLAEYWTKRGEEVTIVTLAGRGEDFYSLKSSVKRIGLDNAGNSNNLIPGLKNNFKRIRALRKVLISEQPAITLGFMLTANILCGLAVWGTGLPAAGSEHTHPPQMPPRLRWRLLRRLVYPRLRFVAAPTRESAEWLKAYAGARQVPVIPNPIAYPISTQQPRLDPTSIRNRLGDKKHWLLAVGRLTEEKGFDRLLAAFAKLAAQYPKWRLIVLGEGPLRPALETQVVALGLDARVAFLGAVGNIGEWYEAASGYVMTSRFEGFGNTLAEALAYGLPSVAVDCETGPRDILRHEIDGFLVPNDDETALVKALQRLLNDKQLRQRFAKRAIEARERFAVDRIATKWEAQFRRCIVC